MSKIYCLMGKSSSGKDTIYQMLLKELKNIKRVILYTTRPIRQGEKNGVEYYFVDEKKLAQMEEEGKVIEKRAYHTVHGVWKYFTADDGQIDLEKDDYLIIGTLASYKEMCHFFGKEKVVPIYLQVDDGVRLERALKREHKQKYPRYEEMCRRFLADNEDFSEKNLVLAKIEKRFNNEELQECLQQIISYVR